MAENEGQEVLQRNEEELVEEAERDRRIGQDIVDIQQRIISHLRANLHDITIADTPVQGGYHIFVDINLIDYVLTIYSPSNMDINKVTYTNKLIYNSLQTFGTISVTQQTTFNPLEDKNNNTYKYQIPFEIVGEVRTQDSEEE